MIGKYQIEIYNNRIHYFLEIKRNITILQGHSATGKTELIRLIGEYEENGVSSGITVKCDVKCTVLTAADWEVRLERMEKRIIFIDETASFVKTKGFAEMVRGSDNYFVIVTRDDLPQLPYSVEEIYGIRTNNSKYKSFHKIYNEIYKIYNFDYAEKNRADDLDLVITEDSNAGYEMFDLIFGDICKSAKGKSNVINLVRSEHEKDLLVIVDGAAFGSEMSKITRYLHSSKCNCLIYAPESFEYIILRTGIIDVPKPITDNTYEYADSCKYLSWEEFYTAYLGRITQNTVFQYSKSSLNDAYKSDGVIERIRQLLPEYIRNKAP